MSSVLGVIPARYASSRFPGKPLAMIAGRSMIERVYERATRAVRVNFVVVATDDARIFDHVVGFGGHAVMTRGDHASGTDRVAEAARLFGGADVVINIQGDEPLLEPALLDDLVDALLASDAGCATPVRRLTSIEELASPSAVKVVLRADNRPLYFSRSPIPHLRDRPMNEWPDAARYHVHIGIYAYRIAALERFVQTPPSTLETMEQLEQLRMFDLDIPMICVPTAYNAQAVDTPEDLRLVEQLIASTSG